MVDLLPEPGGGWLQSAVRMSSEMMVELHVLRVPPIHFLPESHQLLKYGGFHFLSKVSLLGQ